MIRKYLCFLLMLFAALHVFGQTEISGTNPKLESFEIGLDAMAPIRYDFGLSVLLKERISTPVRPEKWVKCGAARLLTTVYDDTRERKRADIFFKNPDSLKYYLDTTQTFNTTVALGYERQLYKKRMRFSFGGDFQFIYDHIYELSTTYWQTPKRLFSTDRTRTEGNQNWVGISIFTGFNYYLTKHLSLGTEIHLPLLFGFERVDVRDLNRGSHHERRESKVRVREPWPRLLYLGLHF